MRASRPSRPPIVALGVPAERMLVMVSWVTEGPEGKPEPESDQFPVVTIAACLRKGVLTQTVVFAVDGELVNLESALASSRWPANRQVHIQTCNWPKEFDGQFLDATTDYMDALALAAFEAHREAALN
jgi:hypothetical protein